MSETPKTRPPLGSYAWADDTCGSLNGWEKTCLVLSMARWSFSYGHGWLRLTFGLVPSEAKVDIRELQRPSTTLARAVVDFCRSEQSEALRGHAFRTWMIGRALAHLDDCALDDELFYCAALLHDFGLMHPTKDRDFTLTGAQKVSDIAPKGTDDTKLEAIREAICSHATIGLSRRTDALGYYVQWGSMSDLAGLRRWRLGRANLHEMLCLHPYGEGLKKPMVSLVQDEAQTFRDGRFALYEKFRMTHLMTWVAPYP